jgi:fructose-1,6-bisphosphatase
MQRRKLVDLFTVKESLRHSAIKIDETGMFACPFHRGKTKGKKVMKHYEELNAAACLNPSCVHYRKVFDAIDLMSYLWTGSKADSELFAEEMLIKELEAYRATGIEPKYPSCEEDEREEEVLPEHQANN